MKNTKLHRRRRLRRPVTHQVSLPSSRRFIFFLIHRRRSSSSVSGTLFIIYAAVLYGRSAVSLRATQTRFFCFSSFFPRLSTRVCYIRRRQAVASHHHSRLQPPHTSSAVAAQNSPPFKTRNPHRSVFYATISPL